MITKLEALNLFDYNPDNGIVTRKITICNRAKAGHIVGSVHSAGYLDVRIDDKLYHLHRIIWLMVYGYFPKEIDHINGIRDDNRIDNLRSVTHQENLKNQKLRTNNNSGVMGIYWAKDRNKWVAQIKINYKLIKLGCFNNIKDAIKVRKEANLKYGFHVNHGRKGIQ